MVTFYHRFIPRAAHTLRPLYEALKGKSPNQAIEWTAEREGAFKDTKAALAQAAMLAHPRIRRPSPSPLTLPTTPWVRCTSNGWAGPGSPRLLQPPTVTQ
ncbi:hypothetical protein AAFF_G00102750 [Aldrovandia affinis]|uniref:Uncharacterized protein n=1 Tax=Aldrovandia affinis TaxID=143900 RepID=A0AAD7WBE4_9TELE|nr:hypothetical protein AAFF_G00102750 [Aldrovandia affinis]